MYGHRQQWVKVSEGGVTDNGLLDLLKSGFVAGIPGEVSIFYQEFLQGAIRVDRPQMKGQRYVTMPRNSWSSVTFMGAGRAWRAWTASTFSGSRWTPLALYRQPKKFMAGPLNAFSMD